MSLVKGDGEEQSFSYDPRGNLLSVTGVDPEDGDQKELATYVYDMHSGGVPEFPSAGSEG